VRRLVFLLLCQFVLAVSPVWAKGQRVWVALSGADAPYLDAAKALRERLPEHEVTVRPWSEFVNDPAPAPRVIVTLGVAAMNSMIQVAAWSKVPVVALLVPRANLEKLADAGHGRVTGVYFDQPFVRQMQFLRLAMPDRRRVGVLLGPGSSRYQGEIRQAVRRAGLEDVFQSVADREDLSPRLRDILAKSDVLLAVPDAVVHNNHTARHVLLASYRQGVPVVGYSSSFVKAGAAAALVSTPEQIGRQGAALAATLLAGGELPEPMPPEDFEVMVNASVSRSLDLALDAEVLTRKLGAGRGSP
jgi:ABC-type uncharacterized transport system substrate-binding protein